ncbi:DMT family transporter [Phycicoccus sp. MAQZ13P-2]|uniref:DMT family transporter n=1 Tax=Phycicoccus mangrovi TaxID=2840470 RepID=UPI001C0047D1|nr:DMT family transporter [Phycicoccus mangrovi]MBT9255429.1 DMT family transporter [Phycicoccus mangrovi]MBT9273541.1 DMT family transporter [Phycicoccus mangrovi]
MASTTTAAPARAGALPLLPAAAFVVVWCSGYVAGPAAVRAVSPFWALLLRFVVAAAVTAALAWRLRGPLRIRRSVLGRIAVVGLMMNGVVFALMYLAFDAGMGATLASLLHALSPVLTAVLAGLVLGERLGRLQVLGFVLGVAGVLVVLGPDVDEAGGALGVALGLLSLVGLSVGTLGQRWFHLEDDPPDPLWAATVQFAVCVPPLALLAPLLEGVPSVADPVAALVSVGWLALVNSVAGLLLLGLLVRRGGAGASSSLFFVCPPVTALMAWAAFGDTLTLREVLGIVVAVVGVGIATGVAGRRRAPTATPSSRERV